MKRNKEHSLSEEKLARMATHVSYEWEMMNKAYVRFRSMQGCLCCDLYLKNMVFESMCIHIRNMIHFFYHEEVGSKVRANDVTHDKYVEFWKPEKPLFDVADCWRRCNKQISHIATERLDFESDKEIKELDLIVDVFNAQWTSFCGALEAHGKMYFAEMKLACEGTRNPL